MVWKIFFSVPESCLFQAVLYLSSADKVYVFIIFLSDQLLPLCRCPFYCGAVTRIVYNAQRGGIFRKALSCYHPLRYYESWGFTIGTMQQYFMINEEVSAYHLVELHDAEAAFLSISSALQNLSS